jgi:predicted DsbA family dithiol-disulfide isomerase
MIKVELWFDFVCPHSYIAKRRFENAMNTINEHDQFMLEWKSFQLNPHVVTDMNKLYDDMIREKKKYTIDQVRHLNWIIEGQAQQTGIEFKLENLKTTNSLNAHRLFQYAKEKKQLNNLIDDIFSAHFVELRNIDDHEVLVELGSKNGLKPKEIKTMLKSERYKNAVVQEQQIANNIGILASPFFLIDRLFGISGVYTDEALIKKLKHALIGKEYE